MRSQLSGRHSRAVGVARIAATVLVAAAASMAIAPSAAHAAGNTLSWTVNDPDTGAAVSIVLTQVPLRGPDFRVRLQAANGSFSDLTSQLAAESSYLGTVPGHPDADAAATVWADGTVHGEVIFDRGATWYFTDHAVTSTRGRDAPSAYVWPVRRSMDSDLIGNNSLSTEVGYDVDSAAYTEFGKSASLVLDTVQNTLNNERLIYMQDAGVTQILGDVVIRGDAASDPYAALPADTSDYLSALRAQWTTALAPYPEDQVQVVSPRVDSGLAYITSYEKQWSFGAYGADPDDWSIFARHENAHNWGVLDENGGDPEGSTIQSGNQYARWDSTELYAIANARTTQRQRLTNNGIYTATPLPPYAGMDLLTAVAGPGTSTILPLVNDHSANGLALHVTHVDAISALGAHVSLGANNSLIYGDLSQPTTAIDHFFYTVSDAAGFTATGVVLVKNETPSTLLEAEGAQLSNASVVSDGSDHSGPGYVTFPSTAGASVQWTVNSPVAEDVTLEFQTENSAVGTAQVLVNNASAGSLTISAAQAGPEGEGTLWGPMKLTAHLLAGPNTITFVPTGVDQLDFLRVDWAANQSASTTPGGGASRPVTAPQALAATGRNIAWPQTVLLAGGLGLLGIALVAIRATNSRSRRRVPTA
jgi:hypothetical protein